MLTTKLRSFAKRPLPDKLNLLKAALCRLKGIYYRQVFGTFGKGSLLFKPTFLSNPQFMHIGDNVVIRQGARLEAVMIDPRNPPELRIGDNVNIEQDVHIVAIGKVRIESNVSITARCAILGGTHPFFNVQNPVKIGNRLAGAESLTVIGEGSFLGIGTVVSMNAQIGKKVVVGSNSVVKGRIPDYCVIDGSPAVPVMKYELEQDSWTVSKAKKAS